MKRPGRKNTSKKAAEVLEPEGSELVDADSLTPSERALFELTEKALADELPLDFNESAPASNSKDITRYDPLESYLAEIRRIPTITREEEHALAIRYKEQGDKVAGYKLVLANLRLVVLIAREYKKNLQNILDLIQEGNIGLLEAVKQYDPYRGIRFPSYAVYWVRAYMLRYLINNIRLVKVGTTQAQRKLFFNLQKEKEKLEREGFAPEAKLLAERMNVKESEVLEMQQRMALPDLSVDAPVRRGEEETDLHGVLPSSTNLEESVAQADFAQVLRKTVEKFKAGCDEKERMIIERRLFTEEEPVTLQEIADQFSLSRERIRQIEAQLKETLKTYLSEKLNLDPQGVVMGGTDE